MRCVTKRGFYGCRALVLALGAGLICVLPVEARQVAKPGYRLAPIAPVHTNIVVRSLLSTKWHPLGFSLPGAPMPQAQIGGHQALIGVADDGPRLRLGNGFFMPVSIFAAGDDEHLAQSLQPVPGQGSAEWRTEEVRLGDRGRGTAINALRLSVRALKRVPGGLVIGPDLDKDEGEAQSFDVSYIRGWPSALMFKAGAYDLDITPHAGLGLSDQGGSAEAGAMVRLGTGLDMLRARQVAESLGLSTVDGQSFGDQGRWYLFAAASGRAVGLNVTRDGSTGNLRGSGWSIDPVARIISDAQAGFGWRQGPVQASLGYIHRDIKNAFEIRGSGRDGDSLIALSFTVRPPQ